MSSILLFKNVIYNSFILSWLYYTSLIQISWDNSSENFQNKINAN